MISLQKIQSFFNSIINHLPKNIFFWILVSLFIVRAFMYASFVPAWQGPDEPLHYDYVHYLQTEKSLPVLGNTVLCTKVRRGLESFYFNSFATGKTPYGQGKLNTKEIKESDLKHDKKNLLQNQIVQHPPLYYMIGAVITWPFKNASLLTNIWILRFFSIILAIGILVLNYKTIRLIFNKTELPALAATAFIAINPMFTHVATLVNNDTLLNFFFALFFFTLTKSIIKGFNLKRSIILGTVMGLGMLTKFFFIFTFPIVVIAFVLFRKELILNYKNVAVTFILPAIFASPILIRNYLLYGTPQPVYKFRFLKDNPFKDMSFVDYLLASSFTRKLFISFWSNFGWVKPRFTKQYYQILFIIAMIVAVGLIIYLIKKFIDKDYLKFKYIIMAMFAPILFSFGIALNSYKSAITTGVVEGVQGRYLFSLIGLLGMLLFLGLKQTFPFKKGYLVFVLIILMMIALDISAIFYYILPYFYY